MRAAIAVLLFSFTIGADALEWKSDLFHCAANLPDGAGWQSVEAPPAPGLTTLVVKQHLGRQAVFGINVVENVPGTNLADPAAQQMLENLLRQFAYQFVGHSTVKVGGLDWLQYTVRAGSGAQTASGVIRFASAGGYIFAITMLRGGGQDAAGDVELQQAAASFRVLPEIAASTPPAPAPMPRSLAAAPAAPPTATSGEQQSSPAPVAAEPASETDSNPRLWWYVGAGVVILLTFFSIIGRGKSDQR